MFNIEENRSNVTWDQQIAEEYSYTCDNLYLSIFKRLPADDNLNFPPLIILTHSVWRESELDCIICTKVIMYKSVLTHKVLV